MISHHWHTKLATPPPSPNISPTTGAPQQRGHDSQQLLPYTLSLFLFSPRHNGTGDNQGAQYGRNGPKNSPLVELRLGWYYARYRPGPFRRAAEYPVTRILNIPLTRSPSLLLSPTLKIPLPRENPMYHKTHHKRTGTRLATIPSTPPWVSSSLACEKPRCCVWKERS